VIIFNHCFNGQHSYKVNTLEGISKVRSALQVFFCPGAVRSSSLYQQCCHLASDFSVHFTSVIHFFNLLGKWL